MRAKIPVVVAICLISFLCSPVFAGRLFFEGFSGSPPEPRLVYPILEKVDLSGKDFLEFKWWNDFPQIRAFEFRLYKGYNMYAAGLIYKQRLPADESSLKIKAELFEDGQVYTWSLIQVSLGGLKSDKSFNSFKVIKKGLSK